MNQQVQQLIDRYKLEPHPEGGFFRETYRSSEYFSATALPDRYGADRSFSTAIYYLLPEGAQSRLHRLKSDEFWHFYLGGPLELIQISPDGAVEEIALGHDISSGQQLQHLVPAGYWFGAQPMSESDFSFVGCTVSPGFDFSDFEMGDRDRLIKLFPAARTVIERLTKQ